jgi:DNA invertase Pin-like site-specific DNA recombinase
VGGTKTIPQPTIIPEPATREVCQTRRTSGSRSKPWPSAEAGRWWKRHEDNGISGAKGRDKRPAFDAALKDAVRRKFDLLMVWSIDRMGRSTATVAAALAELEAAGVAIYADKEAMDATTLHG